MTKKMSNGNFKWVEEILETSDNAKESYFVMIDLHYRQ